MPTEEERARNVSALITKLASTIVDAEGEELFMFFYNVYRPIATLGNGLAYIFAFPWLEASRPFIGNFYYFLDVLSDDPRGKLDQTKEMVEKLSREKKSRLAAPKEEKKNCLPGLVSRLKRTLGAT